MKAIILNLSAWVMLPIMDGFAKYLSSTIPVLQITWSRYFFTVIFVLPIMLIFFRKNFKWTEQPKLQLIRGLLLFSANWFWFTAIVYFVIEIPFFIWYRKKHNVSLEMKE